MMNAHTSIDYLDAQECGHVLKKYLRVQGISLKMGKLYNFFLRLLIICINILWTHVIKSFLNYFCLEKWKLIEISLSQIICYIKEYWYLEKYKQFREPDKFQESE